MTRRERRYDCFACGHVSETVLESLLHASYCPEVGKSPISRAVHCHRCAGEIDARKGPTCPACGADHPDLAKPSAKVWVVHHDSYPGGSTAMRVTELRLGRNFIRAGDTVRVRPSGPNRHDGFLAIFRCVEFDDDGEVRWVEVLGGPRGRCMVRSLRLDRIQRVAQTRNGERKEAVR